jgi:hypothetical protein
MEKILTIFVAVFFAVCVLAIGASVFWSKDTNISKNCRSAAWMAFLIGVILLYLHFVLT